MTAPQHELMSKILRGGGITCVAHMNIPEKRLATQLVGKGWLVLRSLPSVQDGYCLTEEGRQQFREERD